MKYIVTEIQDNEGTDVPTITTAHDTRLEADSKWHQVMSAAALSSVKHHSAIEYDSQGGIISTGCYDHPGETE